MLLDVFGDGFDDAGVDRQQIVAAHARFAGNACGDDHHIRAFEVGIIIGAFEGRIDLFDGAGLRDIERLALGQAFGDVEQNDIPEFFQCGEVGERPADHPGADEGDFLTVCHAVSPCVAGDEAHGRGEFGLA